MSARLNTTTLSATTTVDSDGKFAGIPIGRKASEFTHAIGANDLGVKSNVEIDGTLYLDGGAVTFNTDTDLSVDSGSSNALRFRGKYGGVTKTAMGIDTNSGTLETGLKFVYPKSGIWNLSGTGTGAIHQDERVKLTLSADSGAGGMLRWQNPFGSALVEVLTVRVTTGTGDSGGINIGVGQSGGCAVDNIIDGAIISAARVFNSVNSAGTNGSAVTTIGASDYLIAAASGTVSNFVGYITTRIVPES